MGVAWTIPAEEEKGHSFLSPSSSKRWMHCPASPYLCRTIKEDPKEYSEEGTAAHWLAERAYPGPHSAPKEGDTVTTPAGFTFEVTREMLDAVDVYLGAVQEMEVEVGASAQIEKHVVLIDGVIEGTADCVVVGENEGKINDFKYGVGVDVSAEENSQLMIYALAAFMDEGFSSDAEIEIGANQPRHFRDQAQRSWFTTWGELMAWFDWTLMPAVDKVIHGSSVEGPYRSGTHCRETFCPALEAGKCPAINEANLPVEVMMDKEVANILVGFPTDVDEFSPEQLGAAMALEADFKAWVKAAETKFKKIKSRALGMDQEGYSVPGFKRVAGRKGAAKYTDEAGAVALAREHGIEPYEEKMKTPAKLRDEFKAAGIDAAPLMELTECSQGEEMVPESSKKKALPPKEDPEKLFEDVNK